MVERDPAAHLPDRAEAEYGHGSSFRNRRVLDRLPRRGQDVREVDEALIRRTLGNLDGAEVSLRHPQQLGLASRHFTVELGVAEQGSALLLFPNLRRLALRVKALTAHEAVPAGDVERDHDPVTGLDVIDVRADRLDDPHRLMAEDVPLAQ